jgi:hypothetical protein
VVRRRDDRVVEVPVGDEPPPGDVDTDGDYAALLAIWEKRQK